MWIRAQMNRLHTLATQFPAVCILGARQVGKTTLARQAFADGIYIDLEQHSARQAFKEDPMFQLEVRIKSQNHPLILDEVQSAPELFPVLRGVIDQNRKRMGQFILLGSAQPTLIRQISESLAGRIGVLELDPLTIMEVEPGEPKRFWTDLWLHGGFPDSLSGNFREWWESYLYTFLERDMPQWGVNSDPLFIRRLITMLAHSQGGILNASMLGSSLGVSHHTIQRHLNILEQTFIIRRLQPYFRNVGKRLVKSPKIYLRDTGLVHHVLNINSLQELRNHPVHGASWETFVIEDLCRRIHLRYPHAQFFFWRTADGAEMDLIVDHGSSRVAIEIKTGCGARGHTARSIDLAMADVGASQGWILDQAPGTDILRPGITRISYPENPKWLPDDK